MTQNVCPKCEYIRTPDDSYVHQDVCPACGIVYHKYRSASVNGHSTEIHSHKMRGMNSENTSVSVEVYEPFHKRLLKHFLSIPESIDPLVFWGEVFLTVVFSLWGLWFIVNGIDWEVIGGSFMHNINLAFHEFGHVLFSPFGRFMAILGGSLFQVMMPLIALCVFSFQKRDNFAASIMLWWAGQSFIDVSPYIADAQYRALPLILGMGEEAHDWGNLLTMTNSLESADFIATTSFKLGSLIILLSMVWSAVLLKKLYPRQTQ